MEAGQAQLRPVTLGRKNDLRAEILSGLEEGEQVIIHPAANIDEGIKIEER